jgi:peptide/nickel transport system permease protein
MSVGSMETEHGCAGSQSETALSEAERGKLAFYTATYFQLVWRRFRKHRLATLGSLVLGLFVIVVLFAEFVAPYDPQTRDPDYCLGPPQLPHFFDAEGRFHLRPFVYEAKTTRNPVTLRREFAQDTSHVNPLRFFVKGEEYKLLGLGAVNRHLFGVEQGFIHLFGTDDLARDIFSRVMYATRTSMTIGILGVLISFVLGLVFGGISGYFGGWPDLIIQRLIEIIRSVPTIPLWMTLTAALPKEWSALRIYFAITLILGLIGWTHLARRVRGALLSLRDEDFVMAAKIAGSSEARIIGRHMLPTFMSYIIVDLSVSFPYVIIGETALSFIGLGLRPPVVSWGVLLQAAQNIRSIQQAPWQFAPAILVIVSILAFNFVGDGLRDAADPYSR